VLLAALLGGCAPMQRTALPPELAQLPLLLRPESLMTPPQQITRRLTTEEQLEELDRLVAQTRVPPTLGTGDVLSISVYDEPDLGVASVPIRPDGRISFPLIGEVNKPAQFAFREAMPISRSLALAEGFTPEADLGRVRIIRGAMSNPSLIVFNFKHLLSGKAQDVQLEPNDIVYVPPTYLSR
jgi:protein involved in polysaccharide export with SLBB domain